MGDLQIVSKAIEGIELIEERSLHGGKQFLFKSTNNDYGASVINNLVSYGFEDGLWELAVIEFVGDNWHLTYDTPITDDVLGRLDENEVAETLEEIANLRRFINGRPYRTS